MEKKTRYVVSARECGGRGRYRECGVLASNEHEARRKAVSVWYGSRASWWPDSGLADNYGQVVAPDGNCLSGRIRIDVGTFATTVRHANDGTDWQQL